MTDCERKMRKGNGVSDQCKMVLMYTHKKHRVGGVEGGVLRGGAIQGDGGLPEHGDGVRRAGAARVVGPLHPHGRRRRPRRQLVLELAAAGD